jgi:hypothetical protein
MRHLGIELAKTIEDMVRETMQKIDMKAVKRRILATTPPTDILHRATLINAAMVPMYNHVFMALPVPEEDLNTLHKEIFPSCGLGPMTQKLSKILFKVFGQYFITAVYLHFLINMKF